MKNLKFKPPKRMPLSLTTLSLTIGVVSSLFIQAQAQSPLTLRSQVVTSGITPVVNFEPPDDQTTADDSRGGASRPTAVKCSQDQAANPSMMPLLPASNQGLTVAEHPTFFVYIPQTSALQAHFTLKDENNRGVYQTLFPITKTGGIVSISLPQKQPSLEVGKTYRWSVALICQSPQTDIPVVSGQVRRVNLDSARAIPSSTNSNQLENKQLLEQAALYGKAGIWYDTVTLLAKLRKAQPNDNALTANWVKLFDSVGLNAIANQPLL